MTRFTVWFSGVLALAPAVSSAQDAASDTDAQWARELPDITVSERGCSAFDVHEFRQALRVEARALSQRSAQPYVELHCEGDSVRVVVRDEPQQVGLQRVVPRVGGSGFERELALLVSQRLFSDWLNSKEHREREARRLSQPPKRERRRLSKDLSDRPAAPPVVSSDATPEGVADRRWQLEAKGGPRVRDFSEPFVSWLSGFRLGLLAKRWTFSLGGAFERGRAQRAAGSILLQAVYLEAALRRHWVLTDVADWAVWLNYEQGFVWLRGEASTRAGGDSFARSSSEASGAIGQAQFWTGPVLRFGEFYGAARLGAGYTFPSIRANIVDEFSGDDRPVTAHGLHLGTEVALGVTW